MSLPQEVLNILPGPSEKPSDWRKIFYNAKSHPSNPMRYRFIVVLIIIMIVIYLSDSRALDLHIEQINFAGLVCYLILVIAIFKLAMSIEKEDNKLTSNKWDLLHFSFYFFLAYFIPNNWPLIFCLEIGWELYEDFQGYNLGKPEYIETDQKKMVDVCANSLGYYLGIKFFSIPKVRSKIDGFFHKTFGGLTNAFNPKRKR